MGLPWIQVEKSFAKSQEAIELAVELNLPRPHAVGLAVEFWAWAGDAAPDGIVRGAGRERAIHIADAGAGHDGFAYAMLTVGLLEGVDEGLRIRGWTSRYAKPLEKAARDAERKRAARKRPQDVRGTSAGQSADSPRNGAGKSHIKQSQIEKEEASADSAKKPADPRHHPLKIRLLAAYQRERSAEYAFGAKDATAVSKLLALCNDDGEIEARWVRCLRDKYRGTGELMLFATKKFNDFGGAAPPNGSAGRAIPDVRKGMVRAEDMAGLYGPEGDATEQF
jgi:hypothetical protein